MKYIIKSIHSSYSEINISISNYNSKFTSIFNGQIRFLSHQANERVKNAIKNISKSSVFPRGRAKELNEICKKIFGISNAEMERIRENFLGDIKSILSNYPEKNVYGFTVGEIYSSMAKSGSPSDKMIRVIFLKYIIEKHAKFMNYGKKVALTDLSRFLDILKDPISWFPKSRRMSRIIHLHLGPTNSGKTYSALKSLREAKSGVYLGPLRLLAHEVYERMNNEWKIPCRLITGEERRESKIKRPAKLKGFDKNQSIQNLFRNLLNVDDSSLILPDTADYSEIFVEPSRNLLANHVSSTIEMVDLNKPVDVAVIDEIQMISDPMRGWAWTQALLGLPAKEIHLCGELRALEVLKVLTQKIQQLSNDQIIVHTDYKRLSPLYISNTAISRNFKKLRRGDVLVAFSRKKLFWLKEKIEKATKHRCAIIYGSLPPETRSEQARLFNDPNSGYDILLASDAVGMGLNLAIRRVIFYEMEKFDGIQVKELSVSQTKQIAGRAGRFAVWSAKKDKSQVIQDDQNGLVTTFDDRSLKSLKNLMSKDAEEIRKVGLQPSFDVISKFHDILCSLERQDFSIVPTSLFDTLNLFEKIVYIDTEKYFFSEIDNVKILSEKICKFSSRLPLSEQWQLCCAPVRHRNPEELSVFIDLAKIMVHSMKGAQKNSYGFLDVPSVRKMFISCSNSGSKDRKSIIKQSENCAKSLSTLEKITLKGPPEISLDFVDEEDELEEKRYEFAEKLVEKAHWNSIFPFSEFTISDLNFIERKLWQLESLHRITTLYLWLHYRYPDIYQSGRLAWKSKNKLECVMLKLLKKSKKNITDNTNK